jgi:hypothetical protein
MEDQRMLEIDVALSESYDELTESFVASNSRKVRLEHSLVTLSKWESVWEKPFLAKEDKTTEETVSYIEMMIVDDDLPPEVFQKLLENHLEEVKNYIAAGKTATKLHDDPNAPHSRETLTSELIYYLMIAMNVPVEFEHWHLNRLITLLRVINLKNTPKKKMSAAERRNLNRARLAKHNTRG